MQYNRIMRRMLLFWGLVGVVLMGEAQLWTSPPINFDYDPRCFYSDTTNGQLYIGGNFERLDGIPVYGIISYDGTSWDTLRSDYFTFPVTKILRFQGKLCVAGFGGLMIIDGANIERIPCDGQIRTLYEYEDKLLVGGLFNVIGGDSINTLAAWDGNTWSDVHGAQQYFHGLSTSLTDIVEYHGELYIAGNIYGNGNLREIMRWNGNLWTDVGGGINAGGSAWVNDMEVFNDELVVTGHFFEQGFGPGNCIAIWDGVAWRAMGDGIPLGQLRNLLVFEGELYVSGQFTEIDGIQASYLAHWDGQKWCAFGGFLDNATGEMVVYNDEFYVCGGFTYMAGDSIRYLAKWIGGNHVDTCAVATVGFPETKNQRSTRLLPNPSPFFFSLELPGNTRSADLQIHDVAGRLVVPAQRYRAGEQVDVAALPAGLYFVEVRMRDRVETLKFIKL